MHAKTAIVPANGLANGNSGESIDDIKDSLDRIERLLNCGQQLLYGDEAIDGEGAAASPKEEPLAAASVSIPIARHVDVSYDSYQSSSQRRQSPSRGFGGVGRLAAHHHLTSATHLGLPPRDSGPSAAASSAHSPQSTPQYQASRARANPVSTVSKHHLPRFKRELSASIRGRQIAQIQKEGGMVPNLEEGVDASDTAQNMTIAELKERIHRELEEYRRFGPLMHRLESCRRRQRTAVTKRAPINKRSALGPFPAATTSAPPTLASKPVKQIPTPAPGAALHGAPSRSTVHTAAAAATSGPQGLPASRRVKKSANTTQARSTLQHSQGQTRFWERLYREPAVHQEKRDQRAEQRRMVKRRAKQNPSLPVVTPLGQNAYRGHLHPVQMNKGSRTASCELLSKQTLGCSCTPPQPGSSLPKRESGCPSPTATSKTSMATSEVITKVPGPVVAPWRPSPANSACNTRTRLSVTPSPLPSKPKVDKQQSTYLAEPHDDIELSSPDDAEDSTSPPYIAPLDLRGIKK
ncbi:hypothetical protein LSCM4_06762 [Leishmania orientalis]|uniref:Uncharacterized protein n=1 Tax=Leishmania orientalis TaxID=2249476 RepID=A0A836I058_9TRYP|nr:hypothetical protein LSCM4_06762 [Leishmania orientalis]